MLLWDHKSSSVCVCVCSNFLSSDSSHYKCCFTSQLIALQGGYKPCCNVLFVVANFKWFPIMPSVLCEVKGYCFSWVTRNAKNYLFCLLNATDALADIRMITSLFLSDNILVHPLCFSSSKVHVRMPICLIWEGEKKNQATWTDGLITCLKLCLSIPNLEKTHKAWWHLTLDECERRQTICYVMRMFSHVLDHQWLIFAP